MRLATRLMVASLLAVSGGCGKKAPPLPPLVRLPAAPADFSASRRGAVVTLQFTIPRANTDGSTPASLSRVDVYAMSGAPAMTPEEIVKRGQRVESVAVNEPADPDEPTPASPPRSRKPGDPVDQGAIARVSESLANTSSSAAADVRAYVAVGVNERGRRGAVSRATVPLVAPPPAPGQPSIGYDDKKIAVTWTTPEVADGTALTFRVYVPGDEPLLLTDKPLTTPQFEDTRIQWGAERCYIVRAVQAAGDLLVESEASPPGCATLKDTFPPAAPAGLQAVSVEGVVDLFWESNPETDVAGYHVFRAIAPQTQLAPVTASLLAVPGFRDAVPKNVRVSYAVQAVDTAGNVGPLSAPVEETTR